MVLYGKISSIEIDNTIFKVVFPDRENVVSPAIPKADHVGTLEIGDRVAVIFSSKDLTTGLIVATY